MKPPKNVSINYPLLDKEKINTDFDKAIEKLLAKLGYTRWASGYTFETKIRDIAFTTKEANQSL